jgi:hypothetical protein
MNAPLPPDIAAFLADAAQEFRAAVAPPPWWLDTGWTDQRMQDASDQYQREQIAASQSPDEPGYEVENTK